MQKIRFYLQHTEIPRNFVTKLDFISGMHSYISIDDYRANIFRFPLSFASLSGIKDYFINQIFAEYNISDTCNKSISGNTMNKFRTLKIMESNDYHNFTEVFNFNNNENPIEYIRYAIWNLNSRKISNYSVSRCYEIQTDLQNRQIGYDCNLNTKKEFYIFLDYFNKNYSNHLECIKKLGIDYERQSEVIIIKNEDDINLIKLCDPFFQNEKNIIEKQKLIDLEIKIRNSYDLEIL